MKLPALLLHAASLGLLALSALLLASHAKAIRTAGEDTVPLVAELPRMERRAAALNQQVEMAELQSALRHGSQVERVETLVYPEKPDFPRLITLFDSMRETLTAKGQIRDMSGIQIGDAVSGSQGTVRPLHVSFAAHDQGLHTFLSFLQVAGVLSVSDALTEEERQLLVRRTEEENPAGIVALEQFFSTDLAAYARDPRAYEEQVLRSFSSPAFQSSFQTAIQSPLLREGRQFFATDVAKQLMEQNLWPFPLIVVDAIRIEKGTAPQWQKVSLQMQLHTRG